MSQRMCAVHGAGDEHILCTPRHVFRVRHRAHGLASERWAVYLRNWNRLRRNVFMNKCQCLFVAYATPCWITPFFRRPDFIFVFFLFIQTWDSKKRLVLCKLYTVRGVRAQSAIRFPWNEMIWIFTRRAWKECFVRLWNKLDEITIKICFVRN